MDEPPTTSPLEGRSDGRTVTDQRPRRNVWLRLLFVLAVILAPLGFIIGQQSPDLLSRAVAELAPPTPTPAATATPVPLATILHARPLRLPTLAPGSACPVTPSHLIDADTGDAAGDGPVYLVDDWQAILFPFARTANPPEWAAQDALFLITPGVEGAVLVHGHQLDGPNEVRFGKGDTPDVELAFNAPAKAHPGDLSNPWTEAFETPRLRVAGCYAVQVESEAASSVIVFRAEPQQG